MKKGYTLIELIVIISILVIVLISCVNNNPFKSVDSELKTIKCDNKIITIDSKNESISLECKK